MKTENKTHWWRLSIVNCKLEANSARPRTQRHEIAAATAEEARALAPKVLSHLWGKDTAIESCELYVW